MKNHLEILDWYLPIPWGIHHFHGRDGIGITFGRDPIFGSGGKSLSLGPLKLDISYTPDLVDFLDRELISPGEKNRRDKEAERRQRQSSLKIVAEHNRRVDEHNAAHINDKKGYMAYGGRLSGAKFRLVGKYPYVVGGKDYSIEKGQAFPIYDSDCMQVGNGFPLEINELERVDKDNVFEIYERDINTVWKHVDGAPVNVWERHERKKHINPVPKNPVSRFFVKRRLLKDYNNMNPFESKNLDAFRKTVKTNDFLAVNSMDAKIKMGSEGWHYIVPRTLSGAVIEDMMWGENGPYFEANIVPQLKIPAKELVNYPMIDFGGASVFRRYPKGLEGEKMREKEALEHKFGHLPIAAYNYLERAGVLDEMRGSIDDKYEQIRIARNSKR